MLLKIWKFLKRAQVVLAIFASMCTIVTFSLVAFARYFG